MKKLGKYRLVSRFIAQNVRNTELENLHAGKVPSSKIGDYTDVKVISPYGEIPWNELSRFNDEEMRVLMLDIEKAIHNALIYMHFKHNTRLSTNKEFLETLSNLLFGPQGISWDIPQKEYNRLLKAAGSWSKR